MTMWKSVGFQDGGSTLMEQLISFHDHSMVVLVLIISVVGYIMMSSMFNKLVNRSLLENQAIEVVWTVLPAIILLFIALPSLRLLYLLDEVGGPGLTFKAVGHQWYWSYEYSDFMVKEFDSYLLAKEEMQEGDFRLLEVDNRAVVPVGAQVRVLVTAEDVIHAWTLPSLGVKVDAVPGRLNQLSLCILRPSVCYGQCSEICGANHSFMPIVVESVTMEAFFEWLLIN